MSAKPVKIPRFAATAPGVITGTIVEPSESKKTKGFVTRERPPAQFLGWLFYIIYTWLQYLSDGAFSGASSFDSTLSVASSLTSGGALTVGGQALVVPTTTFTADNTTEIFTATAHGLQTGDGPVRVSNSGGALPTGLTAGTDYWVIRIDANTFYLATSLANALAGTFLTISTNGTGTQSIFSTGSTTRAADASVSRNLTVGGNGTFGHSATVGGDLTVVGTIKHGTQTLSLPFLPPVIVGQLVIPAIAGSAGSSSTSYAIGNAEIRLSGGIGATWKVPIELPAGSTLLEVRARVKDSATGPTILRGFVTKSVDDSPTDLGSGAQSSSGSGAYQNLIFSGLNEPIAASTVYEARFDVTSGAQTVDIHHITVFWAPPGYGIADRTISGTLQVQIPIVIGKKITAVRAIVHDSASGPTTLKVALASNDPSVNNIIGTVVASSASTGSGSRQTLTATTSTTTVSGSTYWATVFYQSGSDDCRVHGLEADFEQD